MSVKPKRLLAELEQHLNILDELPYALLQLNRRGNIVWANLEANNLIGNDPETRHIGEFFQSPILSEAIEAALDDKQGMRMEFRWSRGVTRDLIASIVPLTTKTPQGGWVVVTMQDVTSQRQADRMRVDFVANASHELRTPLSSLVGFIETLQGPASDDADARTRFLRIMQGEANRMSRLLEDLLSLSRIEMNATKKPDSAVDIAAVLRTIRESLEQKAEANGQHIEMLIEGQTIVLGDQDELTQVMWNLTDNAIKYSARESTIRIKVKPHPKGKKIAVSIKDQGEGIPPEHLSRLTERFYRVDKGRSRELGGTGLGLAIVKHILNRHNATLNIKSTVGRGSTFKVSLPKYGGS